MLALVSGRCGAEWVCGGEGEADDKKRARWVQILRWAEVQAGRHMAGRRWLPASDRGRGTSPAGTPEIDQLPDSSV